MINDYNFIAPFYSFLSKVLFGKSLLTIQIKLIPTLPEEGRVLLIGGGNGEILPHIFSKRPNITIDYVEASSSMINLAKQMAPNLQTIQFIHSDTIDPTAEKYDAVFAAFFFDLFDENGIIKWLTLLSSVCVVKHTLHVADFQLSRTSNNYYWRLIQIKASIILFKITSNHRIKHLPKVFETIDQFGYKHLASKYLNDRFLCAKVFSKR